MAANSFHDLAFDELLQWLETSGLMVPGITLDRPRQPLDAEPFVGDSQVLAAPSQRTKRCTREDLKAIKNRTAVSAGKAVGDQQGWSTIWNEIRKPDEAIRELDIRRIPADAIAFYRPFHVRPADQWGIYLVVPMMLRYLSGLERSLGSLRAFPPSVLASMVLFDVFHHEFFHHLVESTATSVEVLLSSSGEGPQPVYLPYRYEAWKTPHLSDWRDPIEEALANAYAFNSFSFVSRTRGGYFDGTSRLYQRALLKSWKLEPPGYRAAACFIKGDQLEGARILIQRMLSRGSACPDLPLSMLADSVFPKGHTAFWQKADIPTYLVGSASAIDEFMELIPAPNETYVNLFWPGDTGPIDSYIKGQRAAEKAEKEKVAEAKAAEAKARSKS